MVCASTLCLPSSWMAPRQSTAGAARSAPSSVTTCGPMRCRTGSDRRDKPLPSPHPQIDKAADGPTGLLQRIRSVPGWLSRPTTSMRSFRLRNRNTPDEAISCCQGERPDSICFLRPPWCFSILLAQLRSLLAQRSSISRAPWREAAPQDSIQQERLIASGERPRSPVGARSVRIAYRLHLETEQEVQAAPRTGSFANSQGSHVRQRPWIAV